MTAQHARPLVAYLCVALVAALLLLQGVVMPSVGPAMLGRAVQAVQVASGAPVLSPDRRGDEVAALASAPRQVAAPTVLSAAPAARSSAATAVRPRAAAAPAGATRRPSPAGKAAPQANAAPAQASGSAQGRSSGKAKGSPRAAFRHTARDSRAAHRGSWAAVPRVTVRAAGASKAKSGAKGRSGAKAKGKALRPLRQA